MLRRRSVAPVLFAFFTLCAVLPLAAHHSHGNYDLTKWTAMDGTVKELHLLVHQQLEAMRQLLSETQKEKLQDFKDERREHVRDRMAHRVASSKELNLTEGQVSKITDIRKDYRPKVHEAGNQLRGLVREEVDLIVGVLKK